MSHSTHSAPPPPNLSHRLVAAGVSAAVAMLFLMLALPLGRQNGASNAAKPPAEKPAATVAPDAVLDAVQQLAREAERNPQAVLHALDPLVRRLRELAPDAAPSSLSNQGSTAQTAPR
ncbi:MAG: hypothetical protein JNM84_14445 [Planctomycetes bacterium]|nr:hypothetical protein [Planctomycetota bacterium]